MFIRKKSKAQPFPSRGNTGSEYSLKSHEFRGGRKVRDLRGDTRTKEKTREEADIILSTSLLEPLVTHYCRERELLLS